MYNEKEPGICSDNLHSPLFMSRMLDFYLATFSDDFEEGLEDVLVNDFTARIRHAYSMATVEAWVQARGLNRVAFRVYAYNTPEAAFNIHKILEHHLNLSEMEANTPEYSEHGFNGGALYDHKGLPTFLVVDQVVKSTADKWSDLCEENGIHLVDISHIKCRRQRTGNGMFDPNREFKVDFSQYYYADQD